MDSFVREGCNQFFISVKYKASWIKYYLDHLNCSDYQITYLEEPSYLGTIGGLHLLKEKVDKTFFLSNCDTLINQEYNEVLDYHHVNKNIITIVAAIKNFSIPYGILNTKENGLLESINEKPDLQYKINTGFYIIEPELINMIPTNSPFDITNLIDLLKQKGKRVGVFPISEKSWKDIGTWNEYLTNYIH
jgi:NDP-sugar pyrophosphorylase family protein